MTDKDNVNEQEQDIPTDETDEAETTVEVLSEESEEETEAPESEFEEEAESPDEESDAPADDPIGETPAPESDAEAEEKRKQRRKKVVKEVRDWVISLVAAVLVVLLARTFLFTIIRVDGTSMVDTLQNGERLYVSVLTSRINGYDRGDVVICHYPNRVSETLFGLIKYDTFFVKRIVAVPGDTLYRENGVTYVKHPDENGAIMVEAIDPLNAGKYVENDYEEYVLGDDEFFVVGDNRYNSNDSRNWKDDRPSNDVGPVTRDRLVGEVRCVIWPLGEIRSVK